MPSQETQLEVINKTSQDLTITVSETEDSDWDGESRPDNNFHDSVIPAGASQKKRAEVNSCCMSSWFKMHIQVSSGDEVFFRADQQNAILDIARLLELGGPHKSKYCLSQACFIDRERKYTNSFCLFEQKQNTSRWMAGVSNHRKLTDMSIPGSHDSCAWAEKIARGARTQTLDPKSQLEAGVRYFDIRCRHFKDTFLMHHGMVYLDRRFDEVLTELQHFLRQNPTETILMSVKEEYKAKDNSRSFEDTFKKYLDDFCDLFHTGTTIPSLGEVRGKIVLLRRFHGGDCGIDLSEWCDPSRDNAEFSHINQDGVEFGVQDYYKVDEIGNNKVRQVEEAMEKAATQSPHKLWINFSSGTNFPNEVPLDFASKVNPRILHILQGKPAGARLGILVMDNIDPCFTEHLIRTNTFVSCRW